MPSAAFQRIVFGEIKHARQQERRDRNNPLRLNGKNRRVVNELPQNLPAPVNNIPDDDLADSELSRKKLLRKQIVELATQPEYVQLLSLVLLEGKPIKVVAERLGLNYSTARTVVARTRRKLTLQS